MTIGEFLQGLSDVIKKGMRAVAKAIAKHGIFSLAVPAALVAVAVAVALYKQQHEPLVIPDEPVAQQDVPRPPSPPPPPKIATSVTKDQDEWMGKYCREQAALLPPAPFKYETKDTYERVKWIPIPPTYVASRMPKDAKGNKPDSMSCGMVYQYDEKEAFASIGVAYDFDINASNEFYQRADQIHTSIMDATWKKISPLNNEEAGRPFYVYEGFPLLFMRENPELGTVEYADMSFAVDYYVKFTVYEKPQ